MAGKKSTKACAHCGTKFVPAKRATIYCSNRCRCFGRRVDPSIRFWAKVAKGREDQCWEWTGGILANGYGGIRVDGFYVRAHRFSWELHFGPIPFAPGFHGMCVCHRCDNRRCVNPGHLFLGTNAENSADMRRKGRMPSLKGEANPLSKLTDADVIDIRTSPLPASEMAARFLISKGNVGVIRRREAWTHV
jgi:hypothetical protein